MNVLTIDLEEWFHVVYDSDEAEWGNKESRILRNADFVLESLTTNNLKATFFTLGWIARQYPDLVKKIHEAGFEIGSHSDTHRAAYKFSKSGFKADVKRSVESLEALTGEKIRSFRAPYFSLNKFIAHYIEALVENGIEIDSSICPIETRYGGYKEFPFNEPCLIKSNGIAIKEFPLNTVNIFNKRTIYSGGGYFRLLPLLLTKALIKQQPYNMTYFHPHDFDRAQPPANLPMLSDIRRRVGAAAAGNKFRKLLSTFDFVDIYASDKLTNWDNAPVLTL
ncbi:polysaccharide deacetylase family protein [Mucilaginibacter agri]|uniref:DUF3473 domain-containing protein n=1 Tax=Mucilaginibacter agri TaxID=2695265 RepID=A0A965ZI70_9SPHI|nr:polysaccharide deacetylase family protein [Mucilaginibacter agri]NCD70156.1 DUF3473 domain-containing protein [Mucilaginibacter agri]